MHVVPDVAYNNNMEWNQARETATQLKLKSWETDDWSFQSFKIHSDVQV